MPVSSDIGKRPTTGWPGVGRESRCKCRLYMIYLQFIHRNVVRRNYIWWRGKGWSQIKPITFGNELRTYDMKTYMISQDICMDVAFTTCFGNDMIFNLSVIRMSRNQRMEKKGDDRPRNSAQYERVIELLIIHKAKRIPRQIWSLPSVSWPRSIIRQLRKSRRKH